MSKALDAEILAGLRELNTADEPQFVKDFMMLFIKTAPERVAAIKNAVTSQDAPKLAQEAHALKSSCASVGANRLMEFCWQLEQMGKKNSLDGSIEVFAQLEKAYEATHAEVLALPELNNK